MSLGGQPVRAPHRLRGSGEQQHCHSPKPEVRPRGSRRLSARSPSDAKLVQAPPGVTAAEGRTWSAMKASATRQLTSARGFLSSKPVVDIKGQVKRGARWNRTTGHSLISAGGEAGQASGMASDLPVHATTSHQKPSRATSFGHALGRAKSRASNWHCSGFDGPSQ